MLFMMPPPGSGMNFRRQRRRTQPGTLTRSNFARAGDYSLFKLYARNERWRVARGRAWTRKPLAGINIGGSLLGATTDKDGRYELHSLAKAKEYYLVAGRQGE